MDVLNQVRAVSSGTLANLTGENRYSVLDSIQWEWIVWTSLMLKLYPGCYKSWMNSWDDYWQQSTYKKNPVP